MRCQDFARDNAKDAAQKCLLPHQPSLAFNFNFTHKREMAPISRRVPGYSEDEEDDYSEAEYEEDGAEQ